MGTACLQGNEAPQPHAEQGMLSVVSHTPSRRGSLKITPRGILKITPRGSLRITPGRILKISPPIDESINLCPTRSLWSVVDDMLYIFKFVYGDHQSSKPSLSVHPNPPIGHTKHRKSGLFPPKIIQNSVSYPSYVQNCT